MDSRLLLVGDGALVVAADMLGSGADCNPNEYPITAFC